MSCKENDIYQEDKAEQALERVIALITDICFKEDNNIDALAMLVYLSENTKIWANKVIQKNIEKNNKEDK